MTVDVQGDGAPGGGGAGFLQGSPPQCFLVVEAENAHENIPAVTKGPAQWEFSTLAAGYSGTGSMVVPAANGPWKDDYAATAPELTFQFEATTTATLYVWIRAFAATTGSNSVHAGIDGNELASAKKIEFAVAPGFVWNTGVHTLSVASLGTHDLNLWAREKQTVIDKIVLTCDPDYRPSGIGPAESPQGNAEPTVGISDASVVEGDFSTSLVTFTLTLSPAATGTVSVIYNTVDRSAEANSDYVADSGPLVFLAGETTLTLDITVLGDFLEEGTETFDVVLSSVSGALLGDDVGQATILDDDGELPGLDARPPNPACSLLERPRATGGITLVNPFPNLNLPGSAVTAYQAPGDNSTWYIVERKGRILAFDNSPNVSSTRVVLDLRSLLSTAAGEKGLKGLAFHPSWPDTPEAIVSYVVPESLLWRISRFTSVNGGTTLSRPSEEILIELQGPANGFHMTGQPSFGPDGFLYVSVGDFALRANGQDTNTVQGSMLRLDVDSAAPYAIPPGNPFASGGGAPELFAWGLRQPWGWSFDRLTGELWVGDVGQDEREEINKIVLGGNYGWSIQEGNLCSSSPQDCADPDLIPPVVDFERDELRCVIGGFVYRGAALPDLFGTYVFGGWSNRAVYALRFDGGGNPLVDLIGSTGADRPLSFAEDQAGEVYVLTEETFLKLVADTGGGGGSNFPQLLSEVPCVNPSDPSQPIDSMIPYELNVPFWSDTAVKERWLALPDGETITVLADGDWDFPIGTVLLKSFRLQRRLIETRLFVRHSDGGWGGYSYEWNDQQTDAALLPAAKTKFVEGQNWTYPSRGDCLACHTSAAGNALGLETAQMNRSMTYATTGRTANQLATYEHIGLFTEPLPAAPADLPALPDPTDANQQLDVRARAYLQANCSHCHRPSHPIDVAVDFRFDTAFAEMGVCNVPPAAGDLGVAGARILLPADPARSIISLRMHSLGAERMPPIGKNIVDTPGVSLIDAWISALSGCP